MMARVEVEAKAKGLFVTFLLTSLHIWNSSGTLVGFSYDAKQGSPMSWSPKETLLSFLQKHKLSSSQLRVFLSNPDAFSKSLSSTQIPVDFFLNSIQSKPSAISWIEDCIVKHLPHLNISTIVVDTTKQDLTSILLTLNSIHSVLGHFDLDGRIKVSLMFSLTDLDMNLASMMEFVMQTKSSIFVEAFVDRELSLGDGFIHSVLQRAIYACSLLLSYPEIPLVLNIKSLVVPGGVEMVGFSEKVMKSIDSHPQLKDRISAIFVEISPLAESEQKKLTWQEEVMFPTSHRQLLDKESVTIHDTVSPVTVPSTNLSPDIVTVPSTTTPTTNLPITSPVPSTNPTTTPIIFPSTNSTTTPITVPATNPVTNPATNPTAPPVTNPTTAPVTVPPAVPVTNPVTTPTTNPVNQPVTNPTTYPLVPPATGTPNTVPVTPATDTPATGTPNTVPVAPATGTPNTVPVTPATGTPSTVPVTPATGTPSTVPVTPATGTPSTVPVTPATGTPSTVPVTPATGTPSTVPVTPATGTPATGTPNTVPVSPAMGTPTGSGQSWCVAKSNVTEDALQDALDYACGIGGADCSAIQMSGSCYNPNSLQSHASYAFNSYYQKNPVPTSCDFGEAAMLVTTNPSTGACVFSSSSSSASSVNPGLNPTSGSNTGIGSTGTGTGPSGVAPTYGSSSGSGSSVLNSSTGSNTVFGSDSPTGIVSVSSFCRPGGWILFGLVIAANLQLLQ